MMTPETMISLLRRNTGVIQRQTSGLTHDDSLLQPPFRGNCLNWVIGHINVYRDNMLKALGESPIMSEADTALYDHGSEPITDGSTAIDFKRLMADLKTAQAQLENALNSVSEAHLNRVEQDRTIRDQLIFYVWHETYHTGQTEYLRQLTGVNDKVI